MGIASKTALEKARLCIRIEREALADTARGLGAEFVDTVRAVEATVAAGGKLVFSGTNCPVGVSYRILTTTNLSTGNWTAVMARRMIWSNHEAGLR